MEIVERGYMIGRLLLLASSISVLYGCSPHANKVQVNEAWVRLPAVVGGAATAYFTIRGSRHDTRLIDVQTALAGRVELHSSMSDGSMASMRQLTGVEVPANGVVKFTPGGMHAMIFNLDTAVTAGTSVPLRFDFSDGTTAEAEAKSVRAGDDKPY